jgi:hypothetical protein
MPKLTPAQMKKAVEEFKKKFTTGFYHGSPSPDIKEFDPTKSKKDPMYTTPKATFVTRDPEFAESFLSMNNSGKIKSGSTMYPVSVNLGQHWNPNTPEGQAVISEFIAAYPKRVNLEKGLKRGDWTAVENSDFIKHLQDTGHSTFHVMEGGVPNVGVFEPQKIRGKFAEYNPEEAANPDFMKAEGGAVGGLDHLAGGGIPKKVVKAYKLFKTKGGNTDELYPLFVNANKPVPLNEWVNAEVGPVAASGKVKSKLGELAYRPGWHAGDLPVATHIGGKSAPDLKAPDFRRPDEVWAEVEMPDDVSWQEIANQRARLNKAGKPIASTAHITDQIPEGGFYRYKTSPNMEGNWLIGGGMKVNRVLTDEEVMAINEAAGVADLPRFTKFNEKAEGGAVEGYAGGGKVGALTELMQLIKNQGGTAAAKRVEKAADLVPNLENKFQPKALKSAFTSDNASAVMVMKPGDFEKYAMPISKEASEYKGYRLGDVYAGDHNQLPKGELEDYLKYLESVKQSGGFRDVPFLNLGQLKGRSFPNIQGHEGRHRMRSLDKAGEESALVQMIPTPNLREPFPRRSQEEYLDALHEKIGRRSFVSPEQTEEGVSRGLIELPEMFAAGGAIKAAKRALEHAKSVPFVHYSNAPNISTLDPNRYGTGIKGAEASRLKSAPDIRPRSYIYTKSGGRKPEQGLGPHKYEGVAEDIYPLHDDPMGFSAIAKERAIDPYMMSMGREVVDEATHLNELERLIKKAGYKGYANDDVGLLFDPTPVMKAE